jgi:uncharacterized protein involved in outer membrane biogenesis
VLAALALLAAAASWALVQAFPPQRLAALLSEQVEAATGRSFQIRGDLSIRLLPSLAVVANDMTLGNAPGGSRPAMATLRRAAFSVALQPLLERRIRVMRIDIEGGDVLLETDASGRGNWLFRAAAPVEPPRSATPPQSGAPAVPIALDKLTVADVTITYRSGLGGVGGTSGNTRTLAVDTLTVLTDGARSEVAATLAIDRQRWQVTGKTGRFEALIAGLQDWLFDLRLQTDGATLTAKGALGSGQRSGDATLQLEARIDRSAALVLLGPQAAAVPLPISVSAAVGKTADALTLDPLRLEVAGQSLSGRVAWTGADTPQLDATMSAQRIDIAPWLPRPGPASLPSRGAPAGQPTPLFGDGPVPWPALPTMPVNVVLQIGQLLLPGAPPLSELSLTLHAQPGRLKVAPLSFGLAQGRVRAEIGLDLADARPPHATLQVQADKLSVQALDTALGGDGHLRGGFADLRTRLSLSGTTPRALAASATGDVLLTVANTALAGQVAALQGNVVVQLFKAVLPVASAAKPLDIECAVVRLPLRNGVARIDRSIALETDRMAVAASGELNLAKQTIALSFRQDVKKGLGLNAASLAQMVSVDGPLNAPRVGVDLKGSAGGLATLGLAGATGGAYLLVSRLAANMSSPQACVAALGVPARAPPQAAENGSGRYAERLQRWSRGQAR